ncbi:YqiA/YcfP family alpha/beta fold hydrolase [uncultured Sutterella sp.]|uniref:YqiA/YcfP family alpha/beta fold hydrolase n=1 Tax=uncultured Sutterella sp. TaxID=286133 RepID=UPI002600752D|nr:YqiA/YcfP family alpha/beta fold hydrolase [uncultured Sutterella sp.]
MTAPFTVVYLHGFLSSPASAKGRELRAAAEAAGRRFEAPDLNLPPREVEALLEGLFGKLTPDARRRTLVTGSSLGGFWALRAARRFGLPAAVVNPCLEPWRFVPAHTGPQRIYGTDRWIEVLAGFADDFRALARETPPAPRDPADLLVLLSTADEVLDWREAAQALAASPRILSVGDDHRMKRFARYLPAVAAFFARRAAVRG